MRKLELELPNIPSYVKAVSGLVDQGMTKKEMQIVALLLYYMQQENTTVISQSMKERVRLSLEMTSQTMHNYWNTLKKKNIVEGNYKNFTLNKIFSSNIQIKLVFDAEKAY